MGWILSVCATSPWSISSAADGAYAARFFRPPSKPMIAVIAVSELKSAFE